MPLRINSCAKTLKAAWESISWKRVAWQRLPEQMPMLSGPLTGANEAQLSAEECGRCKGSRELRDNRT